ncbi:MAG: hypothetical protein KIH69_012305 [Anaerolineae bacterium]|nr:hypothetical protein [Anaerolineae bacterium]
MVKRVVIVALPLVVLILTVGIRQITHIWPANELDRSLRSADDATNRNIRRIVETALDRDDLFGPLSLWIGKVDYALDVPPCQGITVERRYEVLLDRRYVAAQSIRQCQSDLYMAPPSFDPQLPISSIRQVLKTADLHFAKQAVGWCYQLANNPLDSNVMQQIEGTHCHFNLRYENIGASFSVIYPRKTPFALTDDRVAQFIKEHWDGQLNNLDQHMRLK